MNKSNSVIGLLRRIERLEKLIVILRDKNTAIAKTAMRFLYQYNYYKKNRGAKARVKAFRTASDIAIIKRRLEKIPLQKLKFLDSLNLCGVVSPKGPGRYYIPRLTNPERLKLYKFLKTDLRLRASQLTPQ